MQKTYDYPIGQPGKAWGADERAKWLAAQAIKRSVAEQVYAKIDLLRNQFEVQQYGSLPINPDKYPLFVVCSKKPDPDKPNVLITGGVHGYETSGVQGALRFLEQAASDFEHHFNIVVAPCVSPWGYETINRWNSSALDPNRSFQADSEAEEAAALMAYIAGIGLEFLVHMDLHETTDTDNSEFRPALAARDGIEQAVWDIPDGFYTVGDTGRPQPDFQKAIIQSVEKVTHIAPPVEGKIIGEELQQWGVINYPAKPLGLCMGATDARFVTTTEVYPDSPKVDAENCIDAQVAAVTGGLTHVLTAGT